MNKGKIFYVNGQGFLLTHWQDAKLWVRFTTDATNTDNGGGFFFLSVFFFFAQIVNAVHLNTWWQPHNSRWILSLKIDCAEYFRCWQYHVQASPFGIGIEDWCKFFGFFPRRFFGLYVIIISTFGIFCYQHYYYYCYYYFESTCFYLWNNIAKQGKPKKNAHKKSREKEQHDTEATEKEGKIFLSLTITSYLKCVLQKDVDKLCS